MRILIAEDDPISRRLLEHVLAKWDYETVSAHNGDQAWEFLQQEDAPRLAILDWMMPGMDGVEICRRIRELRSEPYTYILLLTAKSQKEDLVAGMDAGADDYLKKPFDAHELRARLRAGQRIIDLQTQLIAAREELRHQAIHDQLTGLYNRAAVLEFLQVEMMRAQREGTPVSIILADLDNFKGINDNYGHNAGDKVLIDTAHRIRSACRPHDIVGRYGGDEFLIVLPGVGVKMATGIADRIRCSIYDKQFVFGKSKLGLSASFGAAQVDCQAVETLEALIDRADKAAYKAKANGRNCTQVMGTGYSADTDPDVSSAA